VRRLFVRRLVMSVLLIVIVPSLTFLFEAITPGNIAEQILGPTATPGQVRHLEAKLGLDQPLYLQYWHWLDGLLHGNLGQSYQTGQSAVATLSPRLPATLSIVLGALVFALVVGVAFGILSATRGRVLPKIIDIGSVFGLAVPGYWLAVILILVLAVRIRLFPATGYVPLTASPAQWLRSLVLPSVALGLGLATFIAKQTRDQLLSVLNRDFIRTLRANGASGSSILFRHALRNAGIPIVTVLGLSLVGALSGSVFVEAVFFLPGLGSALVVAAQSHDLPVVEAISFYFTVFVVVVNLVVDSVYVVLDPRVRGAA
jgi:peptide/nickel transport system permease protein